MSASYCLVGEEVSVFKKNKLSPSLRKKARWGRRNGWAFGKEGKSQRKGAEPSRGEMLQGKMPRRMGGEWEQEEKKTWMRGTEIEVNREEQNEALLGRPHVFRRA